ncbi:MAG: class I SAM-dependent methyltransferase [Armatimonadota bacterium]
MAERDVTGQPDHTSRIHCPLCGSDDHTVVSRFSGLWNYRLTTVACRVCGFVFRNPPWGAQEAAEFYRTVSHYYVETYDTDRLQGDQAPRYAKADARRATWLRGHLPAGAHLLDVGAGNGNLMVAAMNEGLVAEGVELDEEAVANAQQQGLAMQLVPFEEVTWPDGSFAAITMIDVLEHCSDLHAFLRQARRLLSEDGLLFIEVPDISTLHMKPEYLLVPEHNWHFTPRTLQYLLAQVGFEVVEGQVLPEPYDAADRLTVVARKTQIADIAEYATGPGEYERVLAQVAKARSEAHLALSQRLRDLLTKAGGPRLGMTLYRPIIGRYVWLKKTLGLYRKPA